MKADSSDQRRDAPRRDDASLLKELTEQTRLLAQIRHTAQLDPCLLEKIGRIACLTANEVHRNTRHLHGVRPSLEALVEMYRTVNPAAALELDRLAKLRAEIERCCPPEDTCETICCYEPCERPGGGGRGDGYSAKSRGYVNALDVLERHKPWQIMHRPRHGGDKELPGVPLGDFVAQIVPSSPTPQPQDFRSGSATPGAQAPVGFRTFTETALDDNWPPDMSGARGGDVVLMSGNLWLKISVDGGQTFADLDFTKLFAADATYGGWAGDQVVHYIPAIDCFVLYVQSFTGTGPNANKNVVKVALASQADLKKFAGGKPAWRRQWDFTSDTFGLGSAWMDFPDVTYGQTFLHINTNVFAGKAGKLFFELPLADMQAGKGLSFLFAFIDDKTIQCGSPAQNVQGDEFYWAAHAGNSKMRIFSSRGGDPNYAWRERDVANWARVDNNDVVAKAPDSNDWISEDHRIIGATRMGTQLWFAWTAAAGDDGKVVLDGSGNPVIDATRFGDYLHVRLAHPDTRYFGAFGYAVKTDTSVVTPERGKFAYSYIEFGRQKLEPSPVK